MQDAQKTGIPAEIARRLKAAGAPDSRMTPFEPDTAPDPIGLQIDVPADQADALRATLRAELLPKGFLPFLTTVRAEALTEGTRPLAVIAAASDEELVRQIMPEQDDELPVLESGRILKAITHCRTVFGFHIAAITPYGIELAVEALPDTWETFLTALLHFNADEPVRRWTATVDAAIEAAHPGFTAARQTALGVGSGEIEQVTLTTLQEATAAGLSTEDTIQAFRDLADRMASVMEARLAAAQPDGLELEKLRGTRLLQTAQEEVTRTRRVVLQWDPYDPDAWDDADEEG